MTDSLIESLEAVLADPKARPSTKVNAAKELARLRGREPEEKSPLGVMEQIVERYCPQTEEERGLPPDPMRALDFETFTGRRADPTAFSWLPYCPENPGAAERAVLAAARRLGVGTGPYEVPPEDDELSRRRRKRTG